MPPPAEAELEPVQDAAARGLLRRAFEEIDALRGELEGRSAQLTAAVLTTGEATAAAAGMA
eukprot:SAG22_NODE_17428_length_305_cov_0.752427_1_plen_60_part_01